MICVQHWIKKYMSLKIKNRICLIAGVILFCGLLFKGYRYFSFQQLPLKRVAMIHSYASDNPRCLYMNKLLEKEFKKRRIRAEISYHYLDTERKNFDLRIEWFNQLLDSFSVKPPDLIFINDDYALSFFLKSGHPSIGEIPVVFTGVYQLQPMQELLEKYRNITGKWECVDYESNVRFIEKIFQKHVAITAYYELTYMAQYAHREIHEQLKGCPDIHFNHYYLHQMYPDDPHFPADTALFETLQIWGRNNSPYPFSVITFRPYRDMKGVAIIGQSGDIFTQEYFLNDLYGIITVPLGLSHISPTFTVINEPFGFWNAYFGGYFTSCEQQITEGAELAVQIFSGISPADLPITESAKEYMIDWQTLDRFKLEKDILPAGVRFINMPFYERYKTELIIVISLLTFILLSFIAGMIYLYIREQKRTREALQNVSRKNTSLELAIQGGDTYVWRFQDNYFYFEHPIGELPGQLTLEEFKQLIHPEDLPLFDMNRISIKVGRKAIQQYRCKLTGPQYEWWEFRFSSMEMKQGGKTEISGLLINIQNVKDKEEKLILAKKLAEKAELKQSFLANMSHEIRTPLNAIVGFSNILATEEDLEETDKMEFIRTINRNSDLLLLLINDILELSRLESGQMVFEMGECSVRELIDELYATHRMLIPKQLQFLKETAEESPVIWADKGRLTQVITNFLTNACKFTENGYIKLGYDVLKESGEVAIFVEDTGKGISPEQQKMIFDRFYKQDEFAQGTGLGLAICQAIVEKLDGHIVLQSEPGKGSRFAVILSCHLSI